MGAAATFQFGRKTERRATAVTVQIHNNQTKKKTMKTLNRIASLILGLVLSLALIGCEQNAAIKQADQVHKEKKEAIKQAFNEREKALEKQLQAEEDAALAAEDSRHASELAALSGVPAKPAVSTTTTTKTQVNTTTPVATTPVVATATK